MDKKETGGICMFCGERMLVTDDCRKNRTQDYTDGTSLPAIPYGSEGRALFGRHDDGTPMTGNRCHDCNVIIGGYHHPGCDVEECPRCHHQLISCDCKLMNDVIEAAHVVSKTVVEEAKQKQRDAIIAALRYNPAKNRRFVEIDTAHIDVQSGEYAQTIGHGRIKNQDTAVTIETKVNPQTGLVELIIWAEPGTFSVRVAADREDDYGQRGTDLQARVRELEAQLRQRCDDYARATGHLHDLAMLEGTTDSAEQAQRQDILRAYE